MRTTLFGLLVAAGLFVATDARADCTITMNFHNPGTADVELKEIHSRLMHGGTFPYKKQWDGGTRVAPGATYSMTISTNSACDKRKGYRVKYYSFAGAGAGFTVKESTKLSTTDTTVTWEL